jgi:hypothetical protein
MNDLCSYASRLVEPSGKTLSSGQVFAKVLTPNDDSGRHGVLIPTDAYAFFPEFQIPDPTQNATRTFPAFDCLACRQVTLSYKYYERYPERRITRLPGILNNLTAGPRLVVFLNAKHSDGTTAYYFDCANSAADGRFNELFRLIFGAELQPTSGAFVTRPVDAPAFAADATLNELLGKFDEVRGRGWIDTLRLGDTGIGYTFETLCGIKENNDQTADYKGIEIKCQGLKEGAIGASGKINLFQAGPTWISKLTTIDRIKALGRACETGLYSCYSQVTTTPNNLGLLLQVLSAENKIDLLKNTDAVGYWPFARLQKRLAEKHSRAAFVKAEIRSSKAITKYNYKELVYCERPSIERFVDLVCNRNIVFEFTMSEKSTGRVRNHGYPWRLIREEFLDQLFTFQVKLR